MAIGHRGFLKGLGGFFAGLTVAGQIKAKEAKLASTYVRKFRQNSLPKDKSMLSLSGVYTLTGSCHPIACSGIWLNGPNSRQYGNGDVV